MFFPPVNNTPGFNVGGNNRHCFIPFFFFKSEKIKVVVLFFFWLKKEYDPSHISQTRYRKTSIASTTTSTTSTVVVMIYYPAHRPAFGGSYLSAPRLYIFFLFTFFHLRLVLDPNRVDIMNYIFPLILLPCFLFHIKKQSSRR